MKPSDLNEKDRAAVARYVLEIALKPMMNKASANALINFEGEMLLDGQISTDGKV